MEDIKPTTFIGIPTYGENSNPLDITSNSCYSEIKQEILDIKEEISNQEENEADPLGDLESRSDVIPPLQTIKLETYSVSVSDDNLGYEDRKFDKDQSPDISGDTNSSEEDDDDDEDNDDEKYYKKRFRDDTYFPPSSVKTVFSCDKSLRFRRVQNKERDIKIEKPGKKRIQGNTEKHKNVKGAKNNDNDQSLNEVLKTSRIIKRRQELTMHDLIFDNFKRQKPSIKNKKSSNKEQGKPQLVNRFCQLNKVEEKRDNNQSTSRCKRAPRSKPWSEEETRKFFDALAVYGTDFSLMLVVLPNRTRDNLKHKFKKELKLNNSLVELALDRQLPSDYKFKEN